MNLNDAGEMVKNEWLKLPERFKNIELHEYIVMPNHFHSILEIVTVGATVGTTVGATLVVAPNTVGDIVGAFKSIVTVNYIRGVKNMGWQAFNGNIWQRNYYEHIIRNELSYFKISVYIKNNPANWNNVTLK